VEFFEGLDVEFVFALNVFDVFFYFDKVGGEGGPALGLQDGPEPDAARVYADGGDEGAERVPLGMLV
jgi:hypothetical protein